MENDCEDFFPLNKLWIWVEEEQKDRAVAAADVWLDVVNEM